MPAATAWPSPSWPCPTCSSPRGSRGRRPPVCGCRAGDTMDGVIDVVHRTYRSTSLLVLGVLGLAFVVGLAAWVVVDEVTRGRWLVAVAALLWGVVLTELVVEVFLRPRVTTTREGVVLVNPFRTVVVPWEEVRGVETELALQIVVDGGRHSSFAATGNRRSSAAARGG